MQYSHTIYYVPDVSEALCFFEKAFGLQKRFIHESGDYGELNTGACTLAFASESLAKSNLSSGFTPLGQKPQASEIVFTTEDVKAAFDKAISFGAKPIGAPQEKPWGQKVAYLACPFGILVEIASPLKVS